MCKHVVMQNGRGMQHVPAINGQHGVVPGPDLAGLKRKQPEEGFQLAADGQQGNNSPTIRNAPPVHDVFRMRRKQRTKMSDG